MDANHDAAMTAAGLAPGRCPITHRLMPNITRNFPGFHISYSRQTRVYGSDTTAMVLGGRVFFILDGNHAVEMIEAALLDGIRGCLDVFIERIDRANALSEHRMAAGLAADPFELRATTLRLIGQAGMERLVAAAGPLNKKDLSPARFARGLRALTHQKDKQQ